MDMLFQVYEKSYFNSLMERDRINARIQISITIYTAILISNFYMLRCLDLNFKNYITYGFFFLVSIGFIFLIASIRSVSHAITGEFKINLSSKKSMPFFNFNFKSLGYEYRYIPEFKKVSKYREDLLDFFKKKNTSDIEHKVNERLKDNMIKSFGECIDINTGLNRNRMLYVRLSIIRLYKSLFFLFFSVLVFLLFDLDVSSPRKPILIEEVNFSNVIDSIKYKEGYKQLHDFI